MKLGDKISSLKKQRKMSQLELSRVTGISRDAISKYERDEVVPSVEYAKRIADALGVSLDFLVGGDNGEDVLDSATLKRVKDIQALPEQEREKVLSVLDALVRDFRTRQAYA
jgi:transcriptional regulator with XRE-family HTH domain